ncbi:single-stranded DNA-binding protein [Paraburkholderia sp. UCT31]|uniref:single-stranded DNA-binding protein n=1 Tax=Paraburkholderia sp. UCT31 TaxID=2615209 RepID=UPI001655961E|nr:single-stranded DNA-binding protein [Paraburkholderia sp. UCT31]MBC8737293.1 single-stranded DNA-binding protein [Paraburkholderia sp. UCT31]
MSSWAQTQVIGQVGKCTHGTGPNNQPYLTFSVCHNFKKAGSNESQWYQIVLLGSATNDLSGIHKYLSAKSRLVLVQGRPEYEPYVKQDKKTAGLKITIWATSLPVFLDNKPAA